MKGQGKLVGNKSQSLLRASGMAQREKMLVVKADNLSSVSECHTVEGKNAHVPVFL